MGNTTHEIEQRRKSRVERELKEQELADGIAEKIIALINSTVIRPGPKPEERECTTVAGEVEALKSDISEIVSSAIF